MLITSISKQKKDSDRYNVYVDNDYSFSADYEDIINLGIKEDMVLDQDTLKHLIMSCQYKKALDKAIRYLSIRSRSELEVRNRLKSQGFDNEIIEKVICKLKDLEYVSDKEFAKSWIRERKSLKPLGSRRIIQELKNKGVKAEIINESIMESDLDDVSTAVIIAKKKIVPGKKIIKGSKEFGRIYRYLLYRGIDYATASRVLDQLLDERYDE